MHAIDDQMHCQSDILLSPFASRVYYQVISCLALPCLGGSVTFILLAGIYDAGAALVGGSAWTQRVRHREQAHKGPLRRQVDQPTQGGGEPAPSQTQHNHYYSVAFLFGQLQA